MSKKAIAYTADIILGRTGEVISRTLQRETLEKYASENDIEVVAWFEDEAYCEDIMSREGIQALLSFKGSYDVILVERVWSLSRNWPMLRSFIEVCKQRNLQLTAATTLWDCVSQMSRNEQKDRPARLPRASAAQVEAKPYNVRKPKKLHFLQPAPTGHRH
ncbi:MAG: recombinase family protein [Bradymonadales bacterium]|nr:recombinase family protein [Bradymonadales bacterium]